MSREERGKSLKLYATVKKSKTNAENLGQKFLIMENEGGQVKWHGLPQIKDGTL